MARNEGFVEFFDFKVIILVIFAHASLILVIWIALVKEDGSQVSNVLLNEFCGNTADCTGNTIGVDCAEKVSLLSSGIAVHPVGTYWE